MAMPTASPRKPVGSVRCRSTVFRSRSRTSFSKPCAANEPAKKSGRGALMLWYKTWLETRWRFLIGLAILFVLAAGLVVTYPATQRLLLSQTKAIDLNGPIGRLLADALDLQREYRGFIWWQWHRQNLAQMWTLFAVLLGSGGLVTRGSGGAALFTLSLPASRNGLLTTRAAVGMGELVVLAIVPSLVITVMSPSIGQHYSAADAVTFGLCLCVAGSVFFCLALLLSTVFDDVWRPLLLTCAVAVLFGVAELAAGGLAPFGIFHVMSGESYLRA